VSTIAQLVNVCKNYGEGENCVKALKNVNLEIADGDFLAIVGDSGSGKSTFLNILGGLDSPTSGSVFINKKEITRMNDEALTLFRRRNIGFVFQNFNLLPIMTVYENIVLPIHIDGSVEDKSYVNKIMEFLGLNGMENRLPSQLSGGQQQRVAIARALASKPTLILADEPTGNLDSKTSQDVMDLFAKSIKEFKQTLIMITHNDILAQQCDKILIMKDGVLKQ